jgi:hypothetical protein
MSEPSPPLEPRVIAALREEAPAPQEARVRARARLAAAVGIAGGGERAPGHDPRPATVGSGAGAGKIASGALGSHGVAVLAFLAGGAAGAGLHAALTSPPAPRVVYVATTASAPAPTRSSLPDSPQAPVSIPGAPAAAEGAPPATAGSSLSRTSQLTNERMLLDDARASLVQGDASRALDRLRASRREFPRAILAEERDALTVEALVGAHHYDEARAAGDAFRTRYPGSLFAGAVESGLRSIP